MSGTTTRAEETQPAGTPLDPNTGIGQSRIPDTSTPPRMPRWVKLFGVSVLVLVLLAVILMVVGGGAGGHGPGRHTSSSSVTDHVVQHA